MINKKRKPATIKAKVTTEEETHPTENIDERKID